MNRNSTHQSFESDRQATELTRTRLRLALVVFVAIVFFGQANLFA